MSNVDLNKLAVVGDAVVRINTIGKLYGLPQYVIDIVASAAIDDRHISQQDIIDAIHDLGEATDESLNKFLNCGLFKFTASATRKNDPIISFEATLSDLVAGIKLAVAGKATDAALSTGQRFPAEHIVACLAEHTEHKVPTFDNSTVIGSPEVAGYILELYGIDEKHPCYSGLLKVACETVVTLYSQYNKSFNVAAIMAGTEPTPAVEPDQPSAKMCESAAIGTRVPVKFKPRFKMLVGQIKHQLDKAAGELFAEESTKPVRLSAFGAVTGVLVDEFGWSVEKVITVSDGTEPEMLAEYMLACCTNAPATVGKKGKSVEKFLLGVAEKLYVYWKTCLFTRAGKRMFNLMIGIHNTPSKAKTEFTTANNLTQFKELFKKDVANAVCQFRSVADRYEKEGVPVSEWEEQKPHEQVIFVLVKELGWPDRRWLALPTDDDQERLSCYLFSCFHYCKFNSKKFGEVDIFKVKRFLLKIASDLLLRWEIEKTRARNELQYSRELTEHVKRLKERSENRGDGDDGAMF